MKNNCIYFLILTVGLMLSCSEDTIEENGIGSLDGTVVDAVSKTPLANVKIVTNPSSSTVFTDVDGNFLIEAVKTGEYSVQAEFEGYTDAFEAVTILSEQRSSVSFELVVGGDENRAPDVPELLSPENGASDLEAKVEFVWSSSANDTDEIVYTLQLRNGTTNEIQNIEVVADTMATVEKLRYGSNYFWQVTASDGENEPVQSVLGQFSTTTTPENDFLYVRSINGNSVIFSGGNDEDADDENTGEINFNEFQLTSESYNSFKPRRNVETSKIAFLRTVDGATQLHTMNLDGSDIKQVTNAIPLNGFRVSELNYTWAQNGGKLYYPSFDKLYSINPDGGGLSLIYQTPDGSFISEVSAAAFDDNLIALKTNDSNGYNVSVYTVRLSSGTIGQMVYQNTPGAVIGIDLDANGSRLVYAKDTSGSENTQYRQFSSRIYIYNLNTNSEAILNNGVTEGLNDLQPSWSPSEGEIIFTRKPSNLNSEPEIYISSLNNFSNDDLLFTNASMPDWE
ncbi:carboxypeptidase regulatory-like domain-containing protein [Leeuwenhoekiella palythoae]|uniref:carboxypeptidase regulatory-like domain-containing protein n=1 Tax=Leeuwenhoekiella palythoae TaxID=573501 RepID=UPI003511C704